MTWFRARLPLLEAAPWALLDVWLGLLAVAGQQASPRPPAHSAPATPPPKNLIGVLFYFHTVNWKWNGEAVFLCAPSCREHSARYKMYLGQRLAETLGVLTETDGGTGHSDGRGSRGRLGQMRCALER